MAAVRSRGNLSTEVKMARLLREFALHGWRRHCPTYGRPDFCWLREKVGIFVDGCFWHGCPRCYKTPRSHVRYWKAKVLANQERDRRVNSLLKRKGWVVVRIWECCLADKRNIDRVRKALRRNPMS